MTDYATTNATPAAPAGASAVGVIWEQNVGLSFVAEMKATVAPRTAVLGGAAAARPQVGLVFPRGA